MLLLRRRFFCCTRLPRICLVAVFILALLLSFKSWGYAASLAPDTYLSIVPPVLTSSPTASFTAGSDDSNATYKYSVDGNPFIAIANKTFTVGPLGDGPHTIRVAAVDLAGNEDIIPVSYTWTIDKTPPVLEMQQQPALHSNAASSNFEYSTFETGCTYETRLDGNLLASTGNMHFFTGLAEGPHTLEAIAIDAAGNRSAPVMYSWTIDRIAPAGYFLINNGDDYTNNSTLAFTSFVTDASNMVEVRFALNTAFMGATPWWPANNTHHWLPPGIPQGAVTVYAQYRDPAGNRITIASFITYDTIPPVVNITSRPPAVANSSGATFILDATEPVTAYEASLDGAGYLPVITPLNYSGLAEGVHTLQVRATDMAGNAGSTPTTYTWTIDQTPPVGNFSINDGVGYTNNRTLTLHPTGTDTNGPVTVSFSSFTNHADASTPVVVGSPVNWDLPVTATEGVQVVYAQFMDTVGNKMKLWQVVNYDTTLPVVQLLVAPALNNSAYFSNFEYSVNEAGSTYQFWLDGDLQAYTGDRPSFPALADGPHTLKAIVTDRSGNAAAPIVYNWTVDRTAPTGTVRINNGNAYTNDSLLLLAMTVTDSSSMPEMRFATRDDFTDATPWVSFTAAASWSPPGMAAGIVNVYVQFRDSAGNTGLTSSFIVYDNIPPQVGLDATPKALDNSYTSTFAFTTSEPYVVFEVSLDGSAYEPVGSGYMAYSNLPDGDHVFEVRATDKAGNRSVAPAAYSWTVDKSWPVGALVINGGSAFTNNLELSLAITAEDANGPVQVRYSRFYDFADGYGWESFTPTKTWTLAPNTPEGWINLYVMYADAAGNETISSAGINYDITAPEIDIALKPVDLNDPKTQQFVFTTTEWGCKISVSLDGSSFTTLPGITGMLPHTTTYTGLAGGPHTLQAIATDAAGNITGTPATYTWTTDRTAPVIQAIDLPADGPKKAGDALVFVVHMNEAVWWNNQHGVLVLDIGGQEAEATLQMATPTILTFGYTVQAGDLAPGGIGIKRITLKDMTIQDASGNAADLSGAVVAHTGITIAGVPPVLPDVNKTPTVNSIASQLACAGTAGPAVLVNGISAGPEQQQTYTLQISTDRPVFDQLDITDHANGSATIAYQVKAGTTGTARVIVTVKDDGGTAHGGVDVVSTSFDVEVSAIPAPVITSNKANPVPKGAEVQLTATGGVRYVWADGNGIISGQSSAVLTLRAIANTTYAITTFSAEGCAATQTYPLEIKEDDKLEATNLLTPNGDGRNDKWVIRNIEGYPDNEVKIFDRAGKLVYMKKGYANEWDGTLNGRPLATGTYYYLVDLGTDKPPFKGFITLLHHQ